MTKKQFISKYRNEVILHYIKKGCSRKDACEEYRMYKSWFVYRITICFLEKRIPLISGDTKNHIYGIVDDLYEWGPGYVWIGESH